MDYEKEYKKKLEDAKYWHDCSEGDIPAILEEIFSELKEPSDEKIREKLLQWLKLKLSNPKVGFVYEEMKQWIAWLEKQRKEENKNCDGEVAYVLMTDNTRKFKVGDKIRSKNGCYYDEVVEVHDNGAYKLRDLGELYLPEKEWELDNWRPSGKQMTAFEVMLNSDKNHKWLCDDVRLLMQSLYDDLKLMK